LLNVYGRIVYPDLVDPQYSNGKKVYSVTLETIKDHILHGPWGFDGVDFQVNQIQHPYQGAVYQGIARSAGLGFWPSAAYTFLGSFAWEVAGETTKPSINDQVASGIGGSFLGEPLFRLSSLILEDGVYNPGFLRELGAAVISPPTGFNRLAFGDRFKGVFPSHSPATFTRVRLGATLTEHASGSGADNNVTRNEGTLDYYLAYGLPGKDGYTYDRPFDYFDVQFTAVSSQNVIENLMTRGLLYGKKYEAGDNYRGVWGLYGSFDYISPQVFRVSSTVLSLGTTGQWWLTRAIALQGLAFGGIGYGAGGTVHPSEESDYHYGAAGHGLLASRLIFGDKAMFDMTAREYYISGFGSTQTDGSERIFRGNASFTVSVYKRHALGIQYVMSRRDASSPLIPGGSHQTVGTWSIAYNFLGDSRFGAVEWRPAEIEGR
ncbi:MAG TPA: DUF3943 domain-containing protein, partial [Candidatus Deferrimicrobium sp.]|nr:DUF3943 domain-containing protein [Candidatus Deferrimicrobium sp.]